MSEMMITRAVKLIGSSAADAESSLKCMSDDLEKLRLCTAALTHLKERQIVAHPLFNVLWRLLHAIGTEDTQGQFIRLHEYLTVGAFTHGADNMQWIGFELFDLLFCFCASQQRL